MNRPSTSKARGVCSYYTTERGCWRKDNCKFLHGEEQKFTPYDKSKFCKFYANGYCLRGDECWFRHAAPESSPQQNDISDTDADDMCNICLEKPATYGLLAGCGHIFCIKCIRQWRDPTDKSGDMVFSGVIKKCPLCRSPSKFITPSSILLSHNDPEKAAAIEKYKASMARVPCRYFQQSKPTKRFCPFGSDCFYQHRNEDGTPYIFPQGVDYYMRLYKSRQHRVSENGGYAGDATNPISILGRIFSNPFEDLSATIEALRVNLPAFLERLSMEDRDEDGDVPSDEGDETEDRGDGGVGDGNAGGDDGYDDTERTLERLADRMLESLAALRESAQPSPTPALRSDELLDDLPPLEPLYDESTAPELTSPQESAAPSPSPAPPTYQASAVSATSRFSTVVGNRSQERVLIDLESESEDEGEDEDDDGDTAASDRTEHDLALGTSNHTVLAGALPDAETEITACGDIVIRETEAPLLEMNDLERRAAAGGVTAIAGEMNSSESTSSRTVDRVPAVHDQEVDLEPPFVTDGRGRVVWSSTRSSGRGAQVPVHHGQGQAETVSREPAGQGQVQVQAAVRTPAGTTAASERRIKARRTATAREISSDTTAAAVMTTESTGFTTDGRGRVIWTAGSPSPVLQIPIQAGDTVGSGATQVDAVEGDGGSRVETEVEGGAGAENMVTDESSDDDSSRRSFLGRVFDVMNWRNANPI